MSVKSKSPFPNVRPSRTGRILRHFGYHLKAHKQTLGLGGLALLGLAVVELARPWPLKLIFDYVLLPDKAAGDWAFLAPLQDWTPTSVLMLASGLVIVLSLLGAFLSQVQTLSFASAGQKVAGAIRLELFTHVQRLPQSYHDYRQTGELMMRLTNDVRLLKELLVSILMTLGSRAFMVLGMLGVMFYMNWRLTLIALAVLPLLFLTTLRFSVRLKDASRRQRKKEGQLSALVYDGVDSIVLSKMFGQEKRHQSLLSKLISSNNRAELKAKRLQVSYERWVDVITAAGLMLVLFFGVQQVLEGSLSAGSLLVFVSYLRSAYKPLHQISRLSSQIAKATVCGERVLDMLSMKPSVEEKADAISAHNFKGEVIFENVSFAYKSGQRALDGVSFVLATGKTTAIIGPSGAGKSTVAKLLMRLHEPDSGAIYIDGVPIGDYQLKSLRQQITPVSQETLLFRHTIRENISFGKPDATMEEITATARKLGAHEFIQALPNGYETLVGEAGQTLSGGQRQRIAFARAALRDSRIMVFDEPATGLDPVSEKVAQEALAILKKGRTVLLITHRLNLVRLADWVVFLENGTVMEQGAPEELLAARGRFFQFYQEWISQTDWKDLQSMPAPSTSPAN